MDVDEFVARARVALQPILHESGAVLYSAAATLRPGEYYFLGINPGGTNGLSLDVMLTKLPARTTNAYVDECWSPYPQGRHPLQQQVQYLFDALGVPIRDVCASNLIFSRSQGERGAGYPAKALICWSVHQMLLDIVQPHTIITFGRKPFEFVAARLAAVPLPDRPSGHSTWQCREARSDGVRIVGIPHLSRYHLQPHPDILAWIGKHYLRRHSRRLAVEWNSTADTPSLPRQAARPPLTPISAVWPSNGIRQLIHQACRGRLPDRR